MGFWGYYVFTVINTLLMVIAYKGNARSDCDFFSGSWVIDDSYPLYNASAACSFIEREFSCQKNGRPDFLYTKYRWKPSACDLQSGVNFLERFRNKSIMFVGDSLSRNQWQSLTCMLHSSMPTAKYTIAREGDVSTFSFTDYGIKVMLDRNVYLVDVVREKIGRVLKLDSIEAGKLWKGIDMLIFNTWHWWNRRGPAQPWDYIKVGNEIRKDMDRILAFKEALTTWGSWVESNIDPTKTLVFFQGISPSHYNGTQWNEPRAKSCVRQQQPVSGSIFPGGIPLAVDVLKSILRNITKPVKFLDITLLSLLRKDGHPSIYGLGRPTRMDCSHWCLTGVPDTWNEILYNMIL
ncbi:protein trichome birefringence-like 41 isoform X2 [Ricinus communis]|uniref:protein trichome birefringence-like 41 isoform X2 n=1 Tax=Ricinus communis TaxID=3988 RepID=UPI00201A3670|nr:protein trichome birefringence-like 41 isoform X2 [Ricinus communis]